MKTDQERGTFAAWLRRERIARTWKEAEARRRLELAAAPGVSFSTYRDIEAGNRKPTAEQRLAIVTVFGEPPTVSAGPEANGSADLILALGAQTDAINRLIDRLDSLASAAIRDGVRDALREAGLGPDGGASRDEPPPGSQP